MPIARFLTASLMAAAVVTPHAAAQNPDLLYGRVTTEDNRVFEGYMRWDQNEGTWFDILNANKPMPERNAEQGEELRGRHYEHCERGLHIRWGHVAWHNGCGSRFGQGNIRFGHIQRIDVIDGNEARITLRSGDTIELRSNSTDLGRRNRGIFVDDAEGVEELEWGDIETIELFRPTANRPPAFGERLYGTLRIQDGAEFTGYITWDMDEIFGADTLDGRSADANHEIAFGTITAIARQSARSSAVTLRGGETIELRGSNDVNSENRGIAVADPGFGQVTVEWYQFESVQFLPHPGRALAEFQEVRRLRGTVVTTTGQRHSGEIRWDNDEEFTWEHLDGQHGGLDFDIEFGLIRTIERLSDRAARVTVLDGRSFELSGSSDVNDDNRGVFVMQSDGSTVLIDWEDFERVEFDAR